MVEQWQLVSAAVAAGIKVPIAKMSPALAQPGLLERQSEIESQVVVRLAPKKFPTMVILTVLGLGVKRVPEPEPPADVEGLVRNLTSWGGFERVVCSRRVVVVHRLAGEQ